MPMNPEPFSVVLPKCGYKGILDSIERFKVNFRRAEIEMVCSGEREASTYYLNADNYDEQIKYVFEKGLVFQPIYRAEAFRGFAHGHNVVNHLTPGSMSYGVVARDLDTANKFVQASHVHDHVAIGGMLGYPECCCEAFVDYVKVTLDPVFEIAQNTPHDDSEDTKWKIVLGGDQYYELYAHLRYFGLRLIPWLPCSFACEVSRELAKTWIGKLKQLDSQTFKDAENLFMSPSTWDLYNAQVVVNKPPHKSSKFFGYATSVYQPERRVVEFYP